MPDPTPTLGLLDAWCDRDFPVLFNAVCACAFGEGDDDLLTVHGDFFAASGSPAGLRAMEVARWDLAAHRLVRATRLPSDAFREPDWPSFPFGVDREGALAVAATGRRHVALVRVEPFALLTRWPLPDGARVAAALGDARRAVVAHDDGGVFALALDERSARTAWRLDDGRWLGASPDGALGLVALAGELAVIDLASGDVAATLPAPGGAPALHGGLSDDGRTALVAAGGALRCFRDGAWTDVAAPDATPLTAVVVSPSGHRAAVVAMAHRGMSRGGTMALLRLPDGAVLASREEVTTERPAFTRDGRSLWFGAGQALGRVVASNGAGRDVYAGHSREVACVVAAPSGGRFASGGADRTLRVWSPGRPLADVALEGHRGHVCAMAFAPDGATLASCDRAGSLRGWDVASGEERLAWEDPRASFWPGEAHPGRGWLAESLAFSPDGRLLVGLARTWGASAQDQRAMIDLLVAWDVASAKVAWAVKVQSRAWAMRLLGVTPRGVALTWADGTLGWFDPATGAAQASVMAPRPSESHGASVRLLDGDRALALWSGGALQWDVATGAVERRFTFEAPLRGWGDVAVTRDGAVIVLRVSDHDTGRSYLRALDGATGAALGEADPPAGRDSILAMALAPDDRSVAVATRRGAVLRFGLPR